MLDEPVSVATHVFISYPRALRHVANQISDNLRTVGIRPWLDHEAIERGSPDWEDRVRKGVAAAFAVVLLCSPDTIESQYVHAELKLAQRLQRVIIPV